MEINGRIPVRNQKKLTDKDNTENLKIHLKELKFPSDLSMKFHQIYKRDRWHNLMEIHDGQTNCQPKKLDRKTTHTENLGVIQRTDKYYRWKLTVRTEPKKKEKS
jgi:hypothetical protein